MKLQDDSGRGISQELQMGHRRLVYGFWVVALAAAFTLTAHGIPLEPDLSISISDSPDPVAAGDLITYTINLANNGTASAAGVQVELIAPTGTVPVFASVDSGPDWDAPTATATNVVFQKTSGFDMAVSETAQFTVKLKVDRAVAAGTIITTSVTATTTSSETNTADNTNSTTTTVFASSDLNVVLSDSPDPVNPGSNLVYSLTVGNGGPSNAANVVVTLPTPADTTFVAAQTSLGTGWTIVTPSVGGTGNVEISKSVMAQQEGAVFQVTVNVNANATGTIDAQVSVTSDSSDPTPSNDTAAASTTVNVSASTGSVKGKILPKLAWKSGAQWRISTGPGQWSDWQGNAVIVSGLAPGLHTMQFSDLAGWDVPTDIEINVVADATKGKAGVYLKYSSVLVTVAPKDARRAGGLWRVSTGSGQWSNWKKSNQIETDLSPGTHTVQCIDISGWTTPSDKTVTVSATAGTKTKMKYQP